MRTSRMRRCVFVSVVLLGLSACGDDGPSMTPVPPPAPPPDAGGLGPVPPPTAEVPEPSAPAPPVIPWLEAGRPDVAAPAPPELGPCPEGWRRIESATGIAHCDPWPEAGHARCARDDETMLPGDPACRRIGSACPAGDFATDFPAGSTVVHVRPSAEPDGDGTPERPFATIEAAIAGSPQRAILALAKGTYREAVRLNGGRVLWGACVAETVLSVTDASAAGDGVVTVTGRNVGVRNLQIADSGRVGINLRGTGASGVIEDVLVARTTIAGVLASDGASFTMSRSLVREVGLGTATTGDRGVHLQAGATGELSSVVIDGTVGRGISVASDGTILRATDVAVVRTAKPPRSYADAVLAALGGTIELSRVVVDDLDTNAIRAEGAGSRVTATDVLVRGAGASDRSEMDSAVTALMAGQVSLERAAVVGFGEIGVTAFGEGSTVSLADVLVSGRGDEGAVVGTGLYVGFVGSMSASRVAVENVRDFAVGVDEPGSRFDGTDVIVRDVARVDGAMGTVGVQLTNGAAAVLTRVSIERAAEEAAVSHGAGTTLELRDLRVAETDARLSSALRIEELGTMTVERAVLEEVRYVGVSVAHW
ncbi:MAG: hypothetical protein IT379_30770 [Deltaproteobacteria bacterium]|nr:hypothetical protein [Deltaproteobacteria bacterium]